MHRDQRIRPATSPELAWVNEQYQSIGFGLSTSDDCIFLAELDGTRIGLGRLVPFAEGMVELGGIYVMPSARHGGVARAIVEALLAEAAAMAEVWCIPFADLEPFYRSFELLPAGRPWPAYVMEKVADCARRALPPVSVLARRRAALQRD